jgi:hypothetical protein
MHCYCCKIPLAERFKLSAMEPTLPMGRETDAAAAIGRGVQAVLLPVRECFGAIGTGFFRVTTPAAVVLIAPDGPLVEGDCNARVFLVKSGAV